MFFNVWQHITALLKDQTFPFFSLSHACLKHNKILQVFSESALDTWFPCIIDHEHILDLSAVHWNLPFLLYRSALMKQFFFTKTSTNCFTCYKRGVWWWWEKFRMLYPDSRFYLCINHIQIYGVKNYSINHQKHVWS